VVVLPRTPQDTVDWLVKESLYSPKDLAVIVDSQECKLPRGTTRAKFIEVVRAEQPIFDAAIKASDIKPE
jgi:hypothetical protein